MKLIASYLAGLILSVGLIVLLTAGATSPDSLLVGTWQETSWEYEKTDLARPADSLTGKEISEGVKRMIAQDMIVHRSEKWQFGPDGSLRLLEGTAPVRRLNWKMKGRGHVLLLRYNDRLEESYTVARLTENQLVLHFYTEMQARGIARITFTRIQ